MAVKQFIRSAVQYHGQLETQPVRDAIAVLRRAGWPYCPPDQGDVLCRLAQAVAGQNALEVGCATGSTAASMLVGLGDGRLTSIDYNQNQYERAGEKLIAAMGFAGRHDLIEQDSIRALPRLHDAGARFGLVFVDGWKTFDRLWVDTFYCARMLTCGGYIVLDDAQMPAVRKAVSLLRRYYDFVDIDATRLVGGWRLKAWYLLTTRSLGRPYAVLQKTVEIEESDAGRRYDFWRPF